jgi:hypothetical protein
MTAKKPNLKLVSPRLNSPHRRPLPPAGLTSFIPAPEVLDWISATLIATDGPLHNPEHAHLDGANLKVIWAPEGYVKAGRTVLGTAEQVQFMSGGWKRYRQEQQFIQWFGRVPDFLITLAADYTSQCSDVEWCALVEHELFHIAQALDKYGAPAFDRETGKPKLCIRGHDVEEFIGVVSRYGTGGPDSAVSQLTAAANRKPEISGLSVAHACGTCLERAA